MFFFLVSWAKGSPLIGLSNNQDTQVDSRHIRSRGSNKIETHANAGLLSHGDVLAQVKKQEQDALSLANDDTVFLTNKGEVALNQAIENKADIATDLELANKEVDEANLVKLSNPEGTDKEDYNDDVGANRDGSNPRVKNSQSTPEDNVNALVDIPIDDLPLDVGLFKQNDPDSYESYEEYDFPTDPQTSRSSQRNKINGKSQNGHNSATSNNNVRSGRGAQPNRPENGASSSNDLNTDSANGGSNGNSFNRRGSSDNSVDVDTRARARSRRNRPSNNGGSDPNFSQRNVDADVQNNGRKNNVAVDVDKNVNAEVF